MRKVAEPEAAATVKVNSWLVVLQAVSKYTKEID